MFKVVEKHITDADMAVGAETILKVYGPLIERRVEYLVESLVAASESELPRLRGQLIEAWSNLTELRRLAARKQTADEALNKMFAPSKGTAN